MMIFSSGFIPARLRLASLTLLLGLWAASPTVAQPDSTNGWGYPLDSLQADLVRWRQNPLMKVDSIGVSVQGRPIWRVTVGVPAPNTSPSAAPKPTIFVHARTHPAEVQSFYVLREMLRFVTDPLNDTAAALRRDFAFHFIPMYNPDGVVLGKARHNANGIDIESNWNKTVLEPEVAALKATFQSLSPGTATGTNNGTIRVALNLHSDQVNCTRFFFYHHEAGTSSAYAALERTYITGVRSYFIEGIEPWNYVQSWTSGFASQYPESFWWLTRGADVMALTYEDTNCPGAGDFYRTGRALVLGSADYIRNQPVMLARGRTRAPQSQHGARAGYEGAGFEQAGYGAGQGRVVVDRRDGKVVYRDVRGKILKVGVGE